MSNYRFATYPFAHIEKFQVRAYEVDGSGKAPLGTYLNIFNEAAINHAKILGLDLSDLFPKGLTWVLSRLYIEVFDYPVWREQLFVQTWAAGGSNYFALRDFEIYNANGKKMAQGTSSAMMMDLKDRRGVLVKEHIDDIVVGDKRSVQYDYPKLPLISDAHSLINNCELTVRRSDLDINGHVNATQYINWALESVPDNIYKNRQLSSFEITFRAETFHGDHIGSKSYGSSEENDVILHRLSRFTDKREIARCRSSWI